MKHNFLKVIRVIVSILFLCATAFVFVDFKDILPGDGIKAIIYLQFVPSLLEFVALLCLGCSFGFLFFLIVSLLFGRVYCSTVCPVGTLQDIMSWISGKLKRKKFYRYSKPLTFIRYSILAVTAATFLFGSIFIINLLDPYSNFGRIFSGFIRPVYQMTHKVLAMTMEWVGFYGMYPEDYHFPKVAALIYPFVFLLTLLVLSFYRGRLYCNTICPVGTILGLTSKLSVNKIGFDKNKCTSCGKCSRVCKAECIDVKNQKVDFSRCVSCYNCIDVCPESAIKYFSFFKKEPATAVEKSKENPERRKFIGKLFIYTTGLIGTTKIVKAFKPVISNTNTNFDVKRLPVSPPGSISHNRFKSKCTACNLCVSACPSNVLQPSFLEYGFTGIMQPFMDYSTSYCNFECTRCTEVCPTGALIQVGSDEKKTLQLGKVVFYRSLCIVKTEGTACGSCSEHCPTQAVHMVPYRDGLTIPETNVDICVGCGACEHVCPAKPEKAIVVFGNAIHQEAQKPIIKKLQDTVQEDFPF